VVTADQAATIFSVDVMPGVAILRAFTIFSAAMAQEETTHRAVTILLLAVLLVEIILKDATTFLQVTWQDSAIPLAISMCL
jgi:hypothetical protein